MSVRSDLFGTAGLALLVVAALVRVAVLDSGPLALVLGAAGLALCLVYFVRAERSVERFLGKRSTRIGGNVLGTTFFVLGVAVFVNLIASRVGFRLDVTRDRIFTLAPETAAALKALPSPPEVWVLHPESSPAALRIQALLEAARAVEPGLRFHVVDPGRDPIQALRFDLRTFGTVVQVGERFESFLGIGEEELLSALLRVGRPNEPRVGFLEGHGETSFMSTAPEGLREATESLHRRNYRPFPLDLLRGEHLRDSVDVVVVVGPELPLAPGESESLRTFLDSGGSLLVLLDPVLPITLPEILEPVGLRFRSEFLADPKLRDPQVVFPSEYAIHPVVSYLEERRVQVLFPGVGEVEIGPRRGQGGPAGLLFSGRETRVAGDPASEPRSRALAGAAEVSGPTGVGRMVVFGDVDFATNRYFNTLGNGDLFLGAVQWLAERESLVELRPRAQTARAVSLSRQQGRALMVLLVGVLPLGVLGAGVATWWRRR